jgi:hypothetical protein
MYMSIWLYRPCAISPPPPQSAIHKFFEHNIIECRYLNALASVVLPCAASRHTHTSARPGIVDWSIRLCKTKCQRYGLDTWMANVIMGGILKGSDDGIYHCEQLVCWALSIVFNVNKI